MDWLNYHHLLYFWTVAREGSITKACEQLHLSQPTISNQLRQLERRIGGKLFAKAGRGLKLTDLGQVTFRYADEIFTLGRELTSVLEGHPSDQPLLLRVGVLDSLPKLVVYRLLLPALRLAQPMRLVCREGNVNELLQQLAGHELDLVLSDSPAAPQVSVRAFSHLLGQCGITFFGTPPLARRFRSNFPECLQHAPLLLPTSNTALRRGLDHWFDQQKLRPKIIAEFQDSALLKAFGQEGLGLFPVPAAVVNEVQRQYRVKAIGTIDDIQERFFAISCERRLKHPAVVAISQAAKQEFLD
jgi:LysR family transcriptional regulator, transcriptional activator of nhaA